MSVEERQRCVWPETAEVEGGRSGDVRETTLACRNNCRVLAARKILRDITNDLTKVGLSGSFRVAARNCGHGRRSRASSNARSGNDNLALTAAVVHRRLRRGKSPAEDDHPPPFEDENGRESSRERGCQNEETPVVAVTKQKKK